MKKLTKLLSAIFFITAAYAIDEPIYKPKATDSFTEQEIKELKEWIRNKKGQVGIKSLGGDLTVSGQVSMGMGQVNEVVSGVKQVGTNSLNPELPTRAYSVELDLIVNYRAEKTWIASKLKFKNKAGVTSGTEDKVALDRAYIGVRFLQGELYTMDFEFGRRKLNYTFDSFIQFGSFMDGVLFKYDHTLDNIGDFYFHGGPFVVDFKEDYYSFVFEVGFLNILDTGVYAKYSLIDWDTKHFNNPLVRDSFRFMNSQAILGYKSVWLTKPVTLYAAGLINTAAEGLAITADKKANTAWYLGFSVGEARRGGDWSINANYQSVEPQAVPDFDLTGIGRGNASRCGFYYNTVSGVKVPTTRRTAVGKSNYKGYALQFLYLFTNNLTLKQSYAQSIRRDKAVGPIFRNKKYSIELVYIF